METSIDPELNADIPEVNDDEAEARKLAYDSAADKKNIESEPGTAEPARPRIPVDVQYSWSLRAKEDHASDSQELYAWKGNHWSIIERRHAEAFAQNWLTENHIGQSTARKASDCVKHAVNTLFLSDPLPRYEELERALNAEGIVAVLPLLDGYVQIKKDTDGKHVCQVTAPAKEYGLQYCIAASSATIERGEEEWQKAFSKSQFKSFIDKALPDPEVQRLVQEYVGYTLLPDTRFQTAQVWIGSGQNGKGVLKEVVGALHKKHASVNLDNLSGFALEPLIDASLVSVDEVPRHGVAEQPLKTLISGDQIPIDRKNRPGISISPRAKWLICCNELPHVKDQSYGFWRRFQIIRFVLQLKPSEINPQLAKEIIKNELALVFRWAMEGLLRLLCRNRFQDLPAAVAVELSNGQMSCDSTISWSVDREVFVSQDRTEWFHTKEEIYKEYQSWCRENNMGAIASNHFWPRLAKRYPTLNLNGTKKNGRRQTNMRVDAIEIRKRESEQAVSAASANMVSSVAKAIAHCDRTDVADVACATLK